MTLDELYQDLILDHHRHPRCPEPVVDPSAAETVFNPLCGDQINFAVKSDGQKLTAISCTGHGCAISQASGELPLLGDALALVGVRQFPARTRCAMIAWEALELCLKKLSSQADEGRS